MKNIKKNNRKDIFNKILLSLFSVIMFIVGVKLLVPGVYSIFMNLLGVSVNLLSGVVIGSGILGISVVAMMISKCISIKTEYEYDSDIEINSDLMREQLRVVNSKDKEGTLDRKYSYIFDNNYTDVDDIEIDDIMNPEWREIYNPSEVIDDVDDSDVKIYVRKK